MALVVYTDGNKKIVNAKTGAYIWSILSNECIPDSEWINYCDHVADVFLNPDTAPASYLAAFPERIQAKDEPVHISKRSEYVETRKDLV